LRAESAAGARRAGAAGRPEPEGAATVGRTGGRRRRGRQRLARLVQRSAAGSASTRGARVQPGPARGRCARRAGGRIREACRRHALSAGERARTRRRRALGRFERPAGRRHFRQLGARPLGPRAFRPRGGTPAARLGGARRRIRTSVDRRARREELVPRHGGAAAEGDRGRDGGVLRAKPGPRARPLARRPRRRKRCDARAREPRDLPRQHPQPRVRVSPVAARPRVARRALSGRRGGSPGAAGADARPGARRHAFRAARAPARCGGRGAPRRRRVLRHRGSKGGAPAAHLAHRRGEQHLERALRAPAARQPCMERRRGDQPADLPRGSAAIADRDPYRGAEAGGGRICARRRTRLLRGGERAVRGLRAGRPRGDSQGSSGRQQPRARVHQRALPRRRRRPAGRAAAEPGAQRRAHGAPARAGRAPGAAREPAPRPGGSFEARQ